MLSRRSSASLTTMLVLAIVVLTAGCRALVTDKDRDKDKNAGGGTMYRDAGSTRSR